MPVPGVVAADLVVVEAGLVLRRLEVLLDRPAGPGDPDQFLVCRCLRGRTQVVGKFQLAPAVRGERPPDQQVAGPSGRFGAVSGQGGGGPVEDPGPFGAVPAATPLPRLAGACAASTSAREVPASPVTAWLLGTATTQPARRCSSQSRTPRPCRRPHPRSPTRRTPASSARPSISRASSGLGGELHVVGCPPPGSGPGRPPTISAGTAPG